MTDEGLVSLRRDRVRNAHGRVAAEVEAWLGRWAAPGPQTSQIARSGQVLRGMVERLGTRIAELPADARSLAAARGIEWDLSIVEGLFRLLAARFDQRRDPALAPTLKAADELIWSCLQQARVLADPLPLPLAYVDPAFSPSATPRIKPPPALPARDRLLAEMLRVLPVPMIGLPSGIVEEPWWLVLVAHEVGHHVQYDADDAAVQQTGAALKETAGDAAWESWRHEVFADLFAVLALGPVAIDATAELEWDLPEGLAAARSLYPPVMVRLAIMAECAAAAGHAGVPFGAESWADTLAQVPAARREAVAGQLARVPAAVAAVLDLPVGRGSLRRLAVGGAAPAAPRPDPIAAALRRRLAGEDVAVGQGRELPRSAVREAFRSYRGLAAEPDLERRTEAQRRLRERAVALIAEVGDPAVKRARHDPGDTAAIVDRMLDVLREGEAPMPEERVQEPLVRDSQGSGGARLGEEGV